MSVRKNVCCVCALAALTGLAAVDHRREVRETLETDVRVEAAERYLTDADPAVRRHALACLTVRDPERGRRAALRMRTDGDASVKALVREILRTGHALETVIPLSQDPVNDHEIIRLLSVPVMDGRFRLPARIADLRAVEIWVGREKAHLTAFVNGQAIAEYDPVRDASREFRFDVTKCVKWRAENTVRLTDAEGREASRVCSVEVIKCGN